MADQARFVLSVDLGTTTVRACLYDDRARLVAHAAQPTTIEMSGSAESACVEIDPSTLWMQFCQIVKQILAKVPKHAEATLSLCNQRNSFLFWERDTHKPLGKFVVWNDSRGRRRCDEWNKSIKLKCVHMVGTLLHSLTQQPRYQAAKMLRFVPSMVTCRLLTTLEKDSSLRDLLACNRLAFGCIDTWLVFRLSRGNVLVSEPSNVSGTGLYDPFVKSYNKAVTMLIGFPNQLLLPLVDSATTNRPITRLDHRLFGRPLEVSAMLADQQAALFGCGCWAAGDTMVSLGTGTFVLVNLDDRPHSSMRDGIFPLIGWSINGECVHVAQGHDQDTAATVEWARSIGLFDDVAATAAIAASVPSTGGLSFVPGFGGMQTGRNDDLACSGFLGIRVDTTKAHMVRAVLEAIAFRVYEIHDRMLAELRPATDGRIRICGGIAANDFVCQTVATLLDRRIERVEDASFTASRGVALVAGYVKGLWTKQQMREMIRIDRTFEPSAEDRSELVRSYADWQRAADRCSAYYA